MGSRGIGVVIWLVSLSAGSLAAPWVPLDDVRARLAWDALPGETRLHSVWPLSWGRVEDALAQAPTAARGLEQAYLGYELDRVRRQPATSESGFRLANGRAPLSDAAWQEQPENSAVARADALSGNWSLTLSLSHERASLLDDTRWSVRDTQLSWLDGNWMVGAGWVPRHWGASWTTPLGLSENGSDFPAAWVERYRSIPSAGIWRFLGPWHVILFVGQLEDGRAVSHTKVLGARFTFKPLPWFEAGLYRIAQWGGEGRPQTMSSLVDLALGRDNVGSDGIDRNNEPGNQVGGLDLTLSGPGQTRLTLQVQGEDEANGLPSHVVRLAELSKGLDTELGLLQAVLSWADTRTQGGPSGILYNITYNHSIYTSGLRYRARALGSVLDNDARSVALRLYLWQQDSTLWGVRLQRYRLNEDGTLRASAPGGIYRQSWLAGRPVL
ncbi:capsule assembly Wzi family protein [Hahella sp. SMD15-11]|uniref:Capsule assembly Wzi family protein n=1 Tax=Thermohahella caldifontis TaxID=3142973 RepID=A0AB39USF9_9GAMM